MQLFYFLTILFNPIWIKKKFKIKDSSSKLFILKPVSWLFLDDVSFYENLYLFEALYGLLVWENCL